MRRDESDAAARSALAPRSLAPALTSSHQPTYSHQLSSPHYSGGRRGGSSHCHGEAATPSINGYSYRDDDQQVNTIHEQTTHVVSSSVWVRGMQASRLRHGYTVHRCSCSSDTGKSSTSQFWKNTVDLSIKISS